MLDYILLLYYYIHLLLLTDCYHCKQCEFYKPVIERIRAALNSG